MVKKTKKQKKKGGARARTRRACSAPTVAAAARIWAVRCPVVAVVNTTGAQGNVRIVTRRFFSYLPRRRPAG